MLLGFVPQVLADGTAVPAARPSHPLPPLSRNSSPAGKRIDQGHFSYGGHGPYDPARV
jgi:hypothetical protein